MSPATVTFTGVASVPALPSRVAVTVTVVEPAPSATLSGLTLSVTFSDAESSSVSSSVAGITVKPVAVPFTLRVSFPSASVSFSGRIVNVLVPLRSLALIVKVNPVTGRKSSSTVAESPTTVTLTRVSDVPAPSFSAAVTVTVADPASSRTLAGLTLSVTSVD